MSPAAPTTPGPPAWAVGLGVVLIGFVAFFSFQARPAPGGHGPALGVTIALIGFAAATGGLMLHVTARTAVKVTWMLAAVLCAAALIGLQPSGPGLLAVFPAVTAAALRLPERLGLVVLGVALAAVSIADAVRGHIPAFGIVLNDAGVLAFFVIATFARQLSDSNDRTARLLAELEQTRAAQAQAAALAERARLAREMHDVLAHSLSGLVLNLEGARLLAGRGATDPQVGDAIDRAHRLARSGLEEARRAIGMLRDDELPGPDRLAGLAAEFEGDSKVPCTFTVTGTERDLGTDGRLTAYRVAQEALTNIRKHACPARVELRLDYQPSGTRLRIEDYRAADKAAGEAVGHAATEVGGTGYGLTGMAERAKLLGGTLMAGPTDAGFRVELWVPG